MVTAPADTEYGWLRLGSVLWPVADLHIHGPKPDQDFIDQDFVARGEGGKGGYSLLYVSLWQYPTTLREMYFHEIRKVLGRTGGGQEYLHGFGQS